MFFGCRCLATIDDDNNCLKCFENIIQVDFRMFWDILDFAFDLIFSLIIIILFFIVCKISTINVYSSIMRRFQRKHNLILFSRQFYFFKKNVLLLWDFPK